MYRPDHPDLGDCRGNAESIMNHVVTLIDFSCTLNEHEII